MAALRSSASAGPEGTAPLGEPQSQDLSALVRSAIGLAMGVRWDASPAAPPEAFSTEGDVLTIVNLDIGVATGVPAGLGWKRSPGSGMTGNKSCPHESVKLHLFTGLATGVANPVATPGAGCRCEASPEA